MNIADIYSYFHLSKSKGIPRQLIGNLLLISSVFYLYLIKNIQLNSDHLNSIFKIYSSFPVQKSMRNLKLRCHK